MKVLKKLSYGEYVATAVKDSSEMTTRNKDYIAAGAINWITQTSFEPPMVAMAVAIESDLQETIEKSRKFTLHLLAEGQEKLLKKFSETSDINEKTINGMPYERGKNGQVILGDTLGYLICEVEKSITSGDHTLYLAKVLEQVLLKDDAPLTTEKAGIQYA